MSKQVETSWNQLKPVAGTGSGGVCGGLCRGQFFQSRGGSGGQSARRLATCAGIHRTNGIHVVPNKSKQYLYGSCILIALANFQQGRGRLSYSLPAHHLAETDAQIFRPNQICCCMLLHFRIFWTDMAVYSMLPYGPQLLTLTIGYCTLVVWFGHESYQICDSVCPVGARWVQTGWALPICNSYLFLYIYIYMCVCVCVYMYIQTLARRSQQILRMRLHISPSQLQRPVIRSCGSSTYAQLHQKENTQAQPPQMSNVHVRMHENAAVFSDQRQRLATGTSAVRLLRCALREYKLGSPSVLFKCIAEWFLMTCDGSTKRIMPDSFWSFNPVRSRQVPYRLVQFQYFVFWSRCPATI